MPACKIYTPFFFLSPKAMLWKIDFQFIFHESAHWLRNDAVDVNSGQCIFLFVLLVPRRRWSFGLFINASACAHIHIHIFFSSIFRRICAIIFKYGHKSENCFYHKIATLIIWSHIRCHVWIYC